MQDEDKTKEELISELRQLRQDQKEVRLIQQILKHMTEGVFLIREKDGIIVYTNPKLESLFGYESQEMLGKHISLLNASLEKSTKDAGEEILKELDDNKIWQGEVHNIKKDGTLFWCRVSISRFEHSKYGRVWLSVHEDITERKQIEESLHFNKFILDNIATGVHVVNRDGILLYSNPRLEKIFGYQSGELIGKHVRVLRAPGHYADVGEERTIQEFLLKWGAWSGDVHNRKKDGTLFWTRTRIINFEHSNYGSVFLTVQEDITDYKLAEDQLAKTRIHLEKLYASIGDAIFTLSFPDRIMEDGNLAVEQIFGYKPEEYLGKNPKFLYPDGKMFDQFGIELRKAIEEQKDEIRTERIMKRKNGELFPVEANITFLKENEAITHLISVTRDVTEKKLLEEQLRQSSKMEALGTLAGGIAHDFNNILASILGNAERGLMKLSGEKNSISFFENIIESAERAANLVRQILTFSRMDAIQLKPVNLSSLIENALQMVRATIPANIAIHQNLSENCPLILADSTQIHQIILNLCTNACHALENEGGVIEVSLKMLTEIPPAIEVEEGKYLHLMIQDSGKGIRPEDQEKIFDPFFTTKEIGKGTGLGLAVVHGIIEQHQGKITVESEIGQGTTFSLFFPTIDETEIHEESTEKPVVDKQGEGHILIVEDEFSIADLYQQFLESQGYDVTVCNNGLDALTTFKTNPEQFDLVLTDQAMPNMTGKQLAEELFGIRPDIPVLLSTGFSDVIDKEESQEKGIRKYLMKPIKLVTLRQAIEECLRESL